MTKMQHFVNDLNVTCERVINADATKLLQLLKND